METKVHDAFEAMEQALLNQKNLGWQEQRQQGECELSPRQCRDLMDIYRKFGQNGNALPFSISVLLELSKSPDPQAALEEASELKGQGKSITANQY